MKTKFKWIVLALAVFGILTGGLLSLGQAHFSVAHAAALTVTNTDNEGPGSLRQAIDDANGSAGIDVIAFAVSGCGPGTATVCTIALTAPLPDITDPVAMNGALRNGKPGVEIDGTDAGGVLGGLILKNHEGSTVEGMVVNNFKPLAGLVNVGNGLLLDGGGSHTIRNSYFGTDSTGTLASGNQGEGIHLLSSSNNLIENNVASGGLE